MVIKKRVLTLQHHTNAEGLQAAHNGVASAGALPATVPLLEFNRAARASETKKKTNRRKVARETGSAPVRRWVELAQAPPQGKESCSERRDFTLSCHSRLCRSRCRRRPAKGPRGGRGSRKVCERLAPAERPRPAGLHPYVHRPAPSPTLRPRRPHTAVARAPRPCACWPAGSGAGLAPLGSRAPSRRRSPSCTPSSGRSSGGRSSRRAASPARRWSAGGPRTWTRAERTASA